MKLHHILRLILFNVSHIFFYPFTWLFLDFQSRGWRKVPLSGPVIIASNHISTFDPPLIANAQPRAMHFLAKEELFYNPIFRTLIVAYGAFPVRRGMGDVWALKYTLTLLKRNKCLLIFPEGTRGKPGKLREGQTGAGMIAYKSKSKVVPCLLEGATEILPRGSKTLQTPSIHVTFGKPLRLDDLYNSPPSKEVYQAIADRMMAGIAELNKL